MPSTESGLFAELKRRNVFRVAAIYAVAGGLLIQIGEATFDALGLPDGSLRLVIIAVALGFPVALVVGWLFDWTAEGLVRTPDDPEQTVARLRSHRRIDFAIIGVLVLALGLSLFGPEMESPAVEDQPIRSIAVLPLANLSGDPDQEYFSDGMTEALIAELAKIGSLRVISRTSAMRYKQTDLSMPEIAAELGVEGLIEGSVLRDGDEVRITAQLIHGPSDAHLWSQSYTNKLTSVIRLQADVALAIAREVSAAITRDERARLEAAPSVDPQVHDLYLRGRYLWNHRSVESLAQSVRYFERVVEADPTHARGWAGLGDARFLFGFYVGLSPKGPFRAEAREATRRAIELDDSLAEAHAGLGLQLAMLDWKFDEAEREFRRAIELDPGYASTYMWYSELLLFIGRTDEAIAAAETARDLDPFAPPVLSDLGSVYLNAGRPEEAAAALRAALDLDPDYELPRAVLGAVHLTSGQTEAATRELERAHEGSAIASYSLLLARAYARAGETRRARELLREAEGASYASPYHLAGALWELGDTDAALEALERAFDTRDPMMIALKVPLPSTMNEARQVATLYRDHGMKPPAAIR